MKQTSIRSFLFAFPGLALSSVVAGACGTTVSGNQDADPTSTVTGSGSEMGGNGNQTVSSGGSEPSLPSTGCSADSCSGMTPVCDGDTEECRACEGDSECANSSENEPFCSENGACVSCKSNDDCEDSEPFCESGTCRACEAHDECDSYVCELGQCLDTAKAVYVLADIGVTPPAPCGTFEAPCRYPEDAAPQLENERRHLVFLPTTGVIDDGVNLPSLDGIVVVGNNVPLSPTDGETAISISNGSVILDDLVVRGVDAAEEKAVSCTDSTMLVRGSRFSNNATAIHGESCDLTIETSEFALNEIAVFTRCRNSNCSANSVDLRVERSSFRANTQALFVLVDHGTVRNNLFVENGGSGSESVVQMNASSGSHFSFNTLYANTNDCGVSGLVNCANSELLVSSNISHESFPGESIGACGSKVFTSCLTVEHNLSELQGTGEGNLASDPLFFDAANGDFGLESNSIGIDSADASIAPSVDFFGNPRPVGSGPDRGAIEAQ